MPEILPDPGKYAIPDVLPTGQDLLGDFLIAMLWLPLFFALLIAMGAVLFLYGKKFIIEPTHSLRMAIDKFNYLDRRRKKLSQKMKDDGNGIPVDASSDKYPADDSSRESEGMRLPDEDKEILTKSAAGPVSQKMPIHDAPVWIYAFIMVVLGYLAFLGIEALYRPTDADRYWLETLVLGHLPVVRHLVPLKRPIVALIFYLIVNFFLLLFWGNLIYRLLQIRTLYILAKDHPLRRKTLWMWRVCGFIDYRMLDKSMRIWLINPVITLGILLLIVDLMGYFQHQEVLAGGLALGHIFFIAIVRYFDESWMYPVKYEQRLKQTEVHTTPLENLAEVLYRKGVFRQAPMLLTKFTPGKASVSDMPELEIPPFVEELLQSMTGNSSLWDHQAVAWKKMFHSGDSVVVCGPLGCGKRTWARLAAVKEIIYLSGGVLYVMPDRKRLKEEVEAFKSAIERSGLRFNITVLDASSPEFLSQDTAKDIPLLVLADPDSMGNVFLKHWRQFSTFWRVLSRIIVYDISELTGVKAGNFYYYLRRMLMIRSQENVRDIKICGHCSRISAALEDEIEKLLGLSVSFITVDAAPAVPVLFYGIQTSPEDEMPLPSFTNETGSEMEFKFSRSVAMASAVGAGIRREGFSIYYDSRLLTRHRLENEHTLGSWSPLVEPVFDPLKSATSILYVDQYNLFEVMDAVRHYGAFSKKACHVCFLLFSHNPLVQYALMHPEIILPESPQRMYGNFTFYHRNPYLINRHLEEALDNLPMSLSQISGLFGKEIINNLHRQMVREEWIEKIDRPDHPFAGRFILLGRQYDEDLDADVIMNTPLEVVDSSRTKDSVILKGEPSYILLRYYGGRVFMHEDERYTVRIMRAGELREDLILADACEDDVLTTKIRTIEITEFFDEDFEKKLFLFNAPGGQPVEMGIVRGKIRETIMGYITWESDLKPLATVLYGKKGFGNIVVSSGEYCDILMLAFRNREPEKDVLSLIVQLWNAFVPAFFYGASDAFDIFIYRTEGAGSIKSFIAFRELYPGSIGVLLKHDAHQIFAYLNLTRRILRTMPDIGLLLQPYSYRETFLNVTEDLRNRTIDYIDSLLPSEFDAATTTLEAEGRTFRRDEAVDIHQRGEGQIDTEMADTCKVRLQSLDEIRKDIEKRLEPIENGVAIRCR